MFKDDGRVVSNFIFNALRNKPIKIYGNGKQTRSLCFIDDLITGLIKIANLSDNVKGPLNIGNDQEITINDFYHYGWDDDEIHRLSVGELNLIGVDMFKEIEKEHDVTPYDGSFEFHWNFSDFLPKKHQKELETI